MVYVVDSVDIANKALNVVQCHTEVDLSRKYEQIVCFACPVCRLLVEPVCTSYSGYSLVSFIIFQSNIFFLDDPFWIRLKVYCLLSFV